MPVDIEAALMEAYHKSASIEGQLIEAYIRVYMETTGEGIRDIELVRQDGNQEVRWFIRRRGGKCE